MEFFIVLIIGVFVIAAISAGSKRKEEIDNMKTQYQDHLNSIEKELTDAEKK